MTTKLNRHTALINALTRLHAATTARQPNTKQRLRKFLSPTIRARIFARLKG